jgi:hypothetical protein
MDIDTDKIDKAVLALLYLPGRATTGIRWIGCLAKG